MTLPPYQYLAEGAVRYMVDYIKANIGAALDNVSQNVGVPQVQLNNPLNYFIYEQPDAYQCPAVIVIMDDMDFKIEERKSNFVNAQDKINVSIVVEDQDQSLLTVKAWRYQSALHALLDGSTITSPDDAMVLKCFVYRARFSSVYARPEDTPSVGAFRKEVLLECGVTHFEKH